MKTPSSQPTGTETTETPAPKPGPIDSIQINDHWKEYVTNALSPELQNHPQALKDLKRAFFAGALTLKWILENLKDGKEEAGIESITKQLAGFIAGVEIGAI